MTNDEQFTATVIDESVPSGPPRRGPGFRVLLDGDIVVRDPDGEITGVVSRYWHAALLDALLEAEGMERVWIDPADHEDLSYTIACRGYTRPEPGHVPIYVPKEPTDGDTRKG